MFVAPSEPAALRALGTYSPLCEEMGCDYLFITKRGLVGVQRKETNDLVASLNDGRLSTDLSRISDSQLVTAILLVEGSWTQVRLRSHYSREKYQGLTLSCQSRGIMWATTDSVEDTAGWLTRLPVWLDRVDHSSLLRVPKQRGVTNGQRILMQMDGVSLGRARAIEDHFGRVPVAWTCSEEELRAVPGVGKVTARKLMEAL